MALETATYINDLNSANPTSTDSVSQADDHIRLIKAAVKASFPNVTGPVTKTQAQLNNVLDKTGDTMTGALTLSGAPSSNLHAATKAYVDSAFQAQWPVGSIYINATNATNPGTLLGFGTWTAFGSGRVLVGFNASDPLFDTAEETGGSKDAVTVSHTHTYSGTTGNTGSHTHTGKAYAASNGTFSPVTDATLGTTVYHADSGHSSNITTSFDLQGPIAVDSAGSHDHSFSGTTASTGSSATNANIQPYITVYMWKRTA